MGNKTGKSKIWTFLDYVKGDKVVWMIVLLLTLISAVSIFSSTSLTKEVLTGEKTRVDMAAGQLKIIVLGLATVLGLSLIGSIRLLRGLSRLGFALSVALLVFVDAHINLGVIRASTINSAWRVIAIGGFTIHIYEVIKVAMVMYLAWAVDAFKKKELKIPQWLGDKKHFAFVKRPFWQKTIYIYIPMMIVIAGIIPGSFSSALFIAMIMFVTILIGGTGFKDLIIPGIVAVSLVFGVVAVYNLTGWEALKRVETFQSRMGGVGPHEEAFLNAEKGSKTYRDELDKIKQPVSARLAIKQGGLLGKGPGRSTQKYMVPVMYEDYMFSFLVEEYGILGAILVIMLYVSLLARGSIIARNCPDLFGKVTTAGLVILISGQAFMHMFINVGLGPLTGQTLPLISHGRSSFLVFCIAFGVILSISRMSEKRIDKEARNAAPIVVRSSGEEDRIQQDLDDLDRLESDEMLEEIEEI